MLGYGLGHGVEVRFNFHQGCLIGVCSGADIHHGVLQRHDLFLFQFLDAFGHVSLHFLHHLKKFG
eukprot:11353027-Ditylum_brightwellii.AAC.1